TESDPDGRTPFWLEKLPDRPPPRDRVAAWTQDIDAVLARFLPHDRSFSRDARAAARSRLEALERSIARLSDAEIEVELARAIALAGNAHTRLYLVRNRTEVRRLPLRVWWFRDQLRVVRAAGAASALLGCRVTAIDGIEVATAARRVADIESGNALWHRYLSTYYLTSPEVLHAVGLTRSAERAVLSVDCATGGGDLAADARDVSVAALPLERRSTPVEAWWDLAPSHPHQPGDGLRAALRADRAPRYLRSTGRNYWSERVPEDGAIYVQLNRSQPDPARPMAAFVADLAREIDARPPRLFVVDVRFDTGGDLTVATPLVEELAPRLARRRIPVVVLTARSTFSAGITHAAQWVQLAGARVVGEPAGDELDMWSEGGNLVLPCSQLTVHYANGFHAYSRRDYPQLRPYVLDLDVASLEPAIAIEPSWADYLAGRDPVYAAAIAAAITAASR
ncbi:MAG TPA: hypothetical protein VKB80_33605, partial [Kofleriaceae bacterium]|nr:hypothetical protein [Kofleriaceae bacterium]